MGNADLGFLIPLFDLAATQFDGERFGDIVDTDPRSSLGRDDDLLDGYWISTLIRTSITAGVDQVWGLRTVVQSGTVGNHGLWATLRAALENFSSAACLVATASRKDRIALTLNMWHHDFSERREWEKDRGNAPGLVAAEKKLQRVGQLAVHHQVTISARSVGYGRLVQTAAQLANYPRPDEARALWRVASAYAHGRFWQNLQTSTPTSAWRIPGGLTTALALDESKYREIVDVTYKVAEVALERFDQRRRP